MKWILVLLFLLLLIGTVSAAAPVASFTSNETGGIVPVSVQFTNTSSNTPTGWNWSYNTTNLLTPNQANGSETGGAIVGGWQGTETITSDITEYWQGARSVKVVTPNNVANEGGVFTALTGVEYTPYTYSVYLKGSGTVQLFACDMPGYSSITASSIITLTETWTRYTVTRTPVSPATGTNILILTPTQQAATFYIDGQQLEEGTTATPWNPPTPTYFSILQDPIYTFTNTGNFTIYLNASNGDGFNTTPGKYWVNVSPVPVPTTKIYPILSINEVKILPNSDTTLPTEGSELSIDATPDQYEAASFVIKPETTVTDLTLTATELSDGSGHTIPISALDIKVVKVWYQSDDNDIQYTGMIYLTPELLLNNDSLIRVDYTNQTNEIWIKNATSERYIHIDNSSIGTFPDDAQVYDNATGGGFPQPFGLPANENKQIWVTTHVPSGQASGDYTGKMWVNSSDTDPTSVNFTVRVLPFTLPTSTLEYGLFYTGEIPTTDPTILTSETKTSAQQLIELTDMKNHGVLYPTTYQPDDVKLDTALSLRDTAGLPQNKIFVVEPNSAGSAYIGNGTSPAELAAITNKVINWKNHTETYGYANTYFYGMDEVTGDILTSQRTAWETVHSSGGKMFVAGTGDIFWDVGDILDTVIYLGTLDPSESTRWHGEGNEILSYGNPQVGVENPETNRQNYGLDLWRSEYDGTMNFAYQYMFGQSIWNDYDDATYRDHVFAYPKTDGVINTIQWEGWREGVDDTRYADKLTSVRGNNNAAMAVINDGFLDGVDMSVIRGKLIDAILGGSVPPTAEFTAYPTSGHSPLTVTFADLSEDSPTSFLWEETIYNSPENLLTYSEEFDNAIWEKTRSTITTDTILAPDGTTTADAFVEDATAANSHYLNYNFTMNANKTVVFSVYAKAGSRKIINIKLGNRNNVYQETRFFLENGTINHHAYNSYITSIGDGWYRCGLTIPTGYTGGDPFARLYLFDDTGSYLFDGDPTTYPNGIYLWGAQIEEDDSPGSYTHTTTSITSQPWATFSTDRNPAHIFDNGTYDIRLTATNAEGNSTETKYGYISVHDPDAANPETGINSIVAALSIFSIMLIGAGCLGIIYTLGSVGGYVGEQSNNGLIMLSSIGAITIGSVLLILTYAIVSPIATVVGV